MLKIGLIGAESFHATAFAKLARLAPEQGGSRQPARITCLWGEDAGNARALAEAGGIPAIVQDPQQMLGQVDAVMIVLRRGSAHLAAARPFLQAGLPVWVDKPMACPAQQVAELVALARQGGALLDGGSACAEAGGVAVLRDACRRMRQADTLLSAHLNFPAEIDGPYDGLYFYGAHTVELLRAIFGADVQSVVVDRNGNSLIGLFHYPGFTVSVDFAQASRFYATLYGGRMVLTQPIAIDAIYRPAFEHFVERVRGQRPPLPPSRFLTAAAILDALVLAAHTGTCCAVKRLEAPTEGTASEHF